MSREIKFRAWDEGQKYMAYQGTPNLETIQNFMHHFGDEVLMQFTGLYDKNGKEIYEGDIIKYTQHHFNTDMTKEKVKIVKWKYDKWGVYETNAGESEIEIIGNIYENPELLSVK